MLWTSSDWCIYEDFTCSGNCVGGYINCNEDLWILAETVDPRFTLNYIIKKIHTKNLDVLVLHENGYDEDDIYYDLNR